MSQQAPVILLNGSPDIAVPIQYVYKKRTFPMLDTTEIPNVDSEFHDALVNGGMYYGFKFLKSARMAEQKVLFEDDIKKGKVFYDDSAKPDHFSYSDEALAVI